MMGLIYHFVSLNQAQTARRRQLLDNYGRFAQISALVIPLFAFQASFAVRFLVRKLRKSRKVKEHQSPRVSDFPKPSAALSSSYWSRLRWALDEQIVQGWGTRLEWLIGAFWTVWLLLLVVKDTGDDYLHLTKRFGIVAASQLPVHYLLAAKSWSPIQYLTRMSHEELNPYHRLLGRIIITFFSIHASMYLNFFIQSSLLRKRIQDRDVILGLLAIITFLILGTTAISKVRTYSYRLFFVLHVLLSISLLPIIYFHVSHLRIYILESVAVYVILIIQRNVSATPTSATILPLPSSSFLSVILHPKANVNHTYTPGQHIYLSLPATPSTPLNKLRVNPFTIANLPLIDGYMHLVIRPLSGTTQILSKIAAANSKRSSQLLIEGPYGAAPYFPDLVESYDRILLVAGGVGATFTVPIYRSLLQHVREGTVEESRIRFVWSVREAGDTLWSIKDLQGDGRSSLPHGFEVYISGSRNRTSESPGAAEGSFELEERNRLLQDDDYEEQPMIEISASAKRGRPNLRQIVDDVFGHDESERVAVLVCGPVGMGEALRREVGRWVTKGREVFWHNEDFGCLVFEIAYHISAVNKNWRIYSDFRRLTLDCMVSGIMGRKRTLESEDTPMSTESPTLHSFKRGRPRASNPNLPASDSLSINRLKSKIRDTTRLLNRAETIPAGVRIEKERALVGYQHDLARAEEQAEKHKRRQLMIKKYHMVRFVERQKATRILKKTQKRLEVVEEGTAEYESLLVDVHNAEVDVNYTLYHPLDERYQGLYPREQRKNASKDEEVAAERSEKEIVSKPRYWTVVEQCMQDGNLEALREGKLARVPHNAKGKHTASITSHRDGAAEKTASQKGKDKSMMGTLPKDEKDESDGGFFEE